MRSIVLTVKVTCVVAALVLAGCGSDGSKDRQSFSSTGVDDNSTGGEDNSTGSGDNSTGTDPGTSAPSKCLTVCAAIDQTVNAAGSEDNCASSDPSCGVPAPPTCQTYCTSDPSCQLVCDPFLQDVTCDDSSTGCDPATGSGASGANVPLCHWECAPTPPPCSSNDPNCLCPDNSTDCYPACNTSNDCPAGMACDASDGRCKPADDPGTLPCNAESDCPAGTACDASDGQCKPCSGGDC